MDYQTLFDRLLPTIHRAGKEIMQIYASDIEIKHKADSSPVTLADEAAEELILEALKQAAPEIPVISEEAASAGFIPAISERFFLVDPLDGTKEFINKRDEFTINVGLIVNKVPEFGIVYAPALNKIYYNTSVSEAYSADLNHNDADPKLANVKQITTSPPKKSELIAVASRSHLNEATKAFLEKFDISNSISAGSSLKFCLLAQAEADIYPRLAPTKEWDTAAGDAVLRAAGGTVTREDGTPLLYGKTKEDYLNTSFIAWSNNPELFEV